MANSQETEISEFQPKVNDTQKAQSPSLPGTFRNDVDVTSNGNGALSDNEMPSLIDTTEVDKADRSEPKLISRNSESRKSLRKKKNKSLRSNGDSSQLTDEDKRKSKSIEVFDFYVSSIDENIDHAENDRLSTENIKIDPKEKDVIENLLNTIPSDFSEKMQNKTPCDETDTKDSKGE